MSAIKHADGPNGGWEYTLCGDAFDAYEGGDVDEPVVFAKPGERVTCEHCRTVIEHCRKFERFVQP